MKKTIILLGVVAVLTACTTMKISNQEYTFNGRTSQQVKQAILQGCAERGWICSQTSAQNIEGTLNYKATYMVKVDMPYSAQGYKILYKDSANLNANNGKIHKAYYRWTTFLNKSIQKALAEQGWKE